MARHHGLWQGDLEEISGISPIVGAISKHDKSPIRIFCSEISLTISEMLDKFIKCQYRTLPVSITWQQLAILDCCVCLYTEAGIIRLGEEPTCKRWRIFAGA